MNFRWNKYVRVSFDLSGLYMAEISMFGLKMKKEFSTLINNLLAVGRQDRGSCLGETDHCQPLTPLSLLSDSHSKPHLCADFILSSLSFYVGEKLFVYDMKPELEAFP